MRKHYTLLALLFLLCQFTTYSQSIKTKFGKGIIFEDPDEIFKTQLNFRIQNLAIIDFANNSTPTKVNALVRRSRIKLKGHLASPRLRYKFEMGLSNRDIGAKSDFEQVNSSSRLILDALIKYKITPKLDLWFGQTKLPGNRERVTSSQCLQFVDRSLVNSYFNIDRDLGIQTHYTDEIGNSIVKLKASLSMGEGRNITSGNIGGLNYTGRFEFLPFGEFSSKGDYFSADLNREEKAKLAFGITYDFNEDASRQGGQLKNFVLDTLGNYYYTDLSTIFIDAIYKYKGLSCQIEYANKTGDSRVSNIDLYNNKFRTGRAFNIQVGQMLKNDFEISGRYTTVNPDKCSALSAINEYTIGLSKYIVGHKIKLQTDFRIQDIKVNHDLNYSWRFQFEFGF